MTERSPYIIIDQNGRVFRWMQAGHPTSYEWKKGDVSFDVDGTAWQCTAAGFPGVWAVLGSAAGQALAGDVTGTTLASSVVKIQGKAVPVPVVGGSSIVYDAVSGTISWRITPVYASLAAAVAAQASQIIGGQVIVFNTVSTPDDGTYRLTAKTGNAADYTKISDATNVASEIALDAAIPGIVASQVFAVLQEIAGHLIPVSASALAAATTPVATVSGTNAVRWEITASGVAGSFYRCTVNVLWDGINAPDVTLSNIVVTAVPMALSFTVTEAGGVLTLNAVNAEPATAIALKILAHKD